MHKILVRAVLRHVRSVLQWLKGGILEKIVLDQGKTEATEN